VPRDTDDLDGGGPEIISAIAPAHARFREKPRRGARWKLTSSFSGAVPAE